MATRNPDDTREASATQVIDDIVYVAVGKNIEESNLTLSWAIQNFPGKKICILHVHQPAKMIPLSNSMDTDGDENFPASRRVQYELRENKELERKIMHNILDDYLLICDQAAVNAEKLYIEMDDIGSGVVELVYQHAIKNLVMGAAADRHYSEGMSHLKSMKAKYIQQRVPLSCQVWFICMGLLIHTGEDDFTCSSTEMFGESDSITEGSGLELELCKVPEKEEGISIDQLYDQLDQAMAEAEKFKREAFEESLKRGEAQKTAIKAICRVKALESLCAKKLKSKTETEEALAKEKEDHLRTKSQKLEERLIAMDQRLLLEIQVTNLGNKIKEMKDEFSNKIKGLGDEILSAVEQCKEYKKQRDELLSEHDLALKLTEELSSKLAEAEDASNMQMHQFLSVFCFSEIQEATHDFDSSLKIGEGGYGSTYKGFLRHTPVAIKVLSPDSMQGPSEFKQEVNVLSKLRHPNLVTLIGACSESCALIYEYLPNGNLEDHLSCKNHAPPLSWQARIRIATELCSVLIFLHSSSIVHGDLKPGNILLDANFACKLSDFGICRAISLHENSNNMTLFHKTDPKGTFHYLDPHFLTTGELSPKSDTYSFGIILLQLLTGRSAFGIAKEIGDAIDKGNLSSLLDPLAGDWPFVQAMQLSRLALRCCAMNRSSRPDLVSEVWRVLEPMRASSGASSSIPFQFHSQQPPSYFICPILQEVMHDPCVAADGFTYEAEALTGWLESGHDTSPMTNLKLEHFNLVPNHSLRSAIQEWLQRY